MVPEGDSGWLGLQSFHYQIKNQACQLNADALSRVLSKCVPLTGRGKWKCDRLNLLMYYCIVTSFSGNGGKLLMKCMV